MATATMAGDHDASSFLRLDLDRLRRALRLVTALFLGLPVAIFLAGWLRPAAAAVMVVALGVALAGLVARDPHTAATPERPGSVSLPALFVALVPGAMLALASGAGGFGPRNWDWLKHDAVLRDLLAQSWPVRYLTENGTTALVYYVAYYLPAAVTGKLAGWHAANLVVAATSLVGVVLAVLWLVVLARGAPLLCGTLFALFSGMDVLGGLLVQPWPPDLTRIFGDFHLEWWIPHWQYSSTASLMYFVPNQAIAGWLLVAALVDALQSGRERFPLLALLAIGLLWSPFVVVGMLPLALTFLVSPKRTPGASARLQVTAANVAGALLGTVLGLYFASRVLPVALPARFHPATTPAARGDFWLVPAALPFGTFVVSYALFVTCEFALLWVLLVRERGAARRDAELHPMLLAAGGTLLVLPFFHYGLFNDLVMRASIPALFVLVIAAAQALRNGMRGTRRAAIAVVLVVGALYGANLLRMNLSWVYHTRRLAVVSAPDSVRNLFQIQRYEPAAMRRDFVVQYLGSTDSAFFRWLARSSPAQAVDAQPPAARP